MDNGGRVRSPCARHIIHLRTNQGVPGNRGLYTAQALEAQAHTREAARQQKSQVSANQGSWKHGELGQAWVTKFSLAGGLQESINHLQTFSANPKTIT